MTFPPDMPPGRLHLADWVARSGISIIFSIALLWWVLGQQTAALERITVSQVDLQRAVERLTVRVEAGCQVQGTTVAPAMPPIR